MMGTSLQGKSMAMQSTAMDMNAEIELQKLESKLGMGATTSAPAALEQQVTLGGTNNGLPPAAPALPDAAAQC
jgi:hypothetical protein